MTDVVIFVEDPGAANVVAELPSLLTGRGFGVMLTACGAAETYLRERGLEPVSLPEGMTPERLLRETHCRLVVVGTSENPDSFGLALILVARRLKIVCMGIVDNAVNAEFRFCGRGKDPLAYLPDWLLVADSWTRDRFVSLGADTKRVIICGHPHYDTVRRVKSDLERTPKAEVKQRLIPNAEASRKVLLFAAERSSGLDPLTGKGVGAERMEIVLKKFLGAVRAMTPRPFLILRLHPKNTQDECRAYLQEFDAVSQGGLALEWLYVSDGVVGMTSIILLEALLMGRPTLSILPREIEKEWMSEIHAGLIDCAITSQDVRERVKRLVDDPILPASSIIDAALPHGALERLADVIVGRLNCKSH